MGGILAVIEYVGMIMSGFLSISFSVSEIPRARVNCARISEILDAPSLPPAADLSLPLLRGEISLSGVGYRYPGSEGNALSGVDLHILPGEKVAIIGGTGSGKSTLVRLLTGLSAPTEGVLRLDGTDVREMSGQRVREQRKLRFAAGDRLFRGTVRKNVSRWAGK